MMRIARLYGSSGGFADPRRCPWLRGMAEAFLLRAGHEVHVMAAGPRPRSRASPCAKCACRDPREVDWHFAQVTPDLVIERFLPGRPEAAEAAAAERGCRSCSTSRRSSCRRATATRCASWWSRARRRLVGALVSSEQDAQRCAGARRTAARGARGRGRGASRRVRHAGRAQRPRRSRRDCGLHDDETRIACMGPLTRESGAARSHARRGGSRVRSAAAPRADR